MKLVSNIDKPFLICSHLASGAKGYHVWFTGKGTDRNWVCPKCITQYPELPTELIEITDEAFEHCLSHAMWEGIRGVPEIKKRKSSLRFDHDQIVVSNLEIEDWIDVQPNLNSDAEWFVLLRGGVIAVTTPRVATFKTLHRIDSCGFEIDEETGFCVSPRADFGAIYQTSGQRGCVVDLKTGTLTARLDRGEYRPGNSHFPIAFFESDGRSLLVSATNWNRLDVLDPTAGAVLTARRSPAYRSGEQRPEHYLDYFHAQLVISPNGRWIADNGWVWAPCGLIRSWSLRSWLEQNPWESEDGPSLKTIASRAYYWDGPICWIDDSTIAVWGWGEDDEWLLSAVRLMDVRSGEQKSWFPGPETRKPRAWPPKKLAPFLFFDRYLFSVGDNQGTSVWDIASGEQLLEDQALKPIHYHPRSREFLSVTTNGIRLSRLIE